MEANKIIQFLPKSIFKNKININVKLKDMYILYNETLNTCAFCVKYEAVLLFSSIALLSNPINKFIRYIAVNKENKTMNIARGELSLYSQLDKAFESPIKKLIKKIIRL